MAEDQTKTSPGDSVPMALSTELTEPSKCEVAHAEYATETNDSDVKTHWTAKRAIAVASLAGLYTGTYLFIGGFVVDPTRCHIYLD
jgi:hypothetical protein